MGCDIHFVVERKFDGKWLGLFNEDGCEGFAKERHYVLFSKLANVRIKDPANRQPKGVPGDASDLTRYHLRYSDGYHSHSHLTMAEFAATAIEVDNSEGPGSYFGSNLHRENPVYALFKVEVEEEIERDIGESIDDYRVVFWFDS